MCMCVLRTLLEYFVKPLCSTGRWKQPHSCKPLTDPARRSGFCRRPNDFAKLWAMATRPHRHQQAPLLLQGTQAAQEACHHGDAPSDQQQIGSRERGKGQRESGDLGLFEGQPDPHTKQATSSQLHQRQTGTFTQQSITQGSSLLTWVENHKSDWLLSDWLLSLEQINQINDTL